MRIMDEIIKACKDLQPWLVKIRRELHKNAELSFKEFKTKDIIKKYLNEINVDFYEIENSTAIAALINVNSLITVGIRADMDGLPIHEDSNIDYKSEDYNTMHACGHDAHMAIALGVCKVLKKYKNHLKVNLKFIFQPGEESGGGKIIINHNVLENPKVDYIFSLHMGPHLKCGTMEIKSGVMAASTDRLHISIKGKKSHGAYPHEGIDAIVIASYLITSLQTIVSRNIDPNNSVVITFGKITGGNKGNIICDEVNLVGTLRTLNYEDRLLAKKRIEEICTHIGSAFNSEIIVNIKEGIPPLINDNNLVDKVIKNGIEVLGKDNVIIKKTSSMGAEDFAYFLEKIPGVFFNIGCSNNKIHSPIHTPTFNIDENCLVIGVMMQVKNILMFQ